MRPARGCELAPRLLPPFTLAGINDGERSLHPAPPGMVARAVGQVWWPGVFGDGGPVKRRHQWAAEVRACSEGESWAGQGEWAPADPSSWWAPSRPQPACHLTPPSWRGCGRRGGRQGAMLSLELGRLQRGQRPPGQPVAQGHAGWSRGASGRQRPPSGVPRTALWAPVGAWGPDMDEPHCQPSGALGTPGTGSCISLGSSSCLPLLPRPQHAASCRHVFATGCLPAR